MVNDDNEEENKRGNVKRRLCKKDEEGNTHRDGFNTVITLQKLKSPTGYMQPTTLTKKKQKQNPKQNKNPIKSKMSVFCLKTTIYTDAFTGASSPCTRSPSFLEPLPVQKTL